MVSMLASSAVDRDLQLPVQSVPIATKIVSSNHACSIKEQKQRLVESESGCVRVEQHIYPQTVKIQLSMLV
jgi:hypothetical protein